MAQFDFLTKLKNRMQEIFSSDTGVISPVPLEVSEPPQNPTPTPSPTPQPGEIPGGTDLATNYIQDQLPQGQTPEQYLPAMGDPGFMQGVQQADQQRQGLSNLLLLQALFESTMGKNSQNLFGVLPPGGKQFSSPTEALDYQLGPQVLGGGGNPNMNILDEQRPLTLDDVQKLYQSYDPAGGYLEKLIQALSVQQ
jgi:hypothetical protein